VEQASFYDPLFFLPAHSSGKNAARKKTGNLKTNINNKDRAILPIKDNKKGLIPDRNCVDSAFRSEISSSLPQVIQKLAVYGLLV